jgi:DNA-binding MurR/RpiR family transcriptional regulator
LNERLLAIFDALPSRLKAAAKWIIDNPDEVALLSMREQARRAGISPTTFMRLAQRLDFASYEDIRQAYGEQLRQRPGSFQGRAEELVDYRGRVGDAALATSLVATLRKHLDAISEPGRINAIIAAADKIANCERVYCLGTRSGFSVAYIFNYTMSLVSAKSTLVDQAGGTASDLLRFVGPRDVVLAVALEPYTLQTVRLAELARERDATIVAITDSELSPLARISEDVLSVGAATPSFFHSLTPAFATAETLAALTAVRIGPSALKMLVTAESHFKAMNVFWTNPG